MEDNSFLRRVTKAIPLGERTTSDDFTILSNLKTPESLQRLAFLDSRGKKTIYEGERFLAELLAEEWGQKNEGYLILTRTHASTTFFTLINFLCNLDLEVPYLLTNVGFVDFTPKKRTVIDDILLQSTQVFGVGRHKLIELEAFQLSSGAKDQLFALEMDEFANKFADYLAHYCQKMVFIGTNEIPADIQFERKRPHTFYTQLSETNKFLKMLTEKGPISLATLMLPEIKGRIQDHIFDGVHFTQQGHQSLFQELKGKGLI